MKTMIFVLFFSPFTSFANTGFTCSSLHLEISKKTLGESATLVVKNTENQTEVKNENLILPTDATIDAYQDRFGTYYTIMEYAQTHFPYMPETLLMFHLGKSSKLYKKGFKAFEGEATPSELTPMYCKALVEAIQNF